MNKIKSFKTLSPTENNKTNFSNYNKLKTKTTKHSKPCTKVFGPSLGESKPLSISISNKKKLRKSSKDDFLYYWLAHEVVELGNKI